jgi:hypothetical protein
MWTSTKAATSPCARERAGIASTSPPNATIASRSVVPSASRRSRSAGSKRPASARLPTIEKPKRTPSSSPNATTSIACAGRTPRAWSSPTAAIAHRMPKMPS